MKLFIHIRVSSIKDVVNRSKLLLFNDDTFCYNSLWYVCLSHKNTIYHNDFKKTMNSTQTQNYNNYKVILCPDKKRDAVSP